MTVSRRWIATLCACGTVLLASLGTSCAAHDVRALADTSIAYDPEADPSGGDGAGDGRDGEPEPASPTTLVVEPDDGRGPILSAITGAAKSVHLEVYLLTDKGVISALVAAKKRGCEVRVVLEKAPYLATGANRPAHDTLVAGGVEVAWSTSRYALTHTKTMVIDGAVAWVMTLNLTSAGVGSNREYAARDDDPADVAEAEAILAADMTGVAPSLGSGRLVVSPINSRAKIGALIDGARATLDIEMEALTDPSIIAKIASAIDRAVAVRIVVSLAHPADMHAKLVDLQAKGARVRTLAAPDVHAKAIVADAARAYLGSVNMTHASFDRNREIGVITDTPATLIRLGGVIGGDFARAGAL